MSTEDHPDWWRPVGGSNSQDSTLERRSLVWNDDGIVDGVAPPAFYTFRMYRGKFFTRGCRGMMEQLQIYCIATAGGALTLRCSPHPGLGPIRNVLVVPGAAWAWVSVNVEQMWDYDSLFVWVDPCDADVSWAYDAVEPHDGHESINVGSTWEDLPIRPFIRVVYTGETPGDVPVSGVINNIPIPSVGSHFEHESLLLPANITQDLVLIDSAGYCSLILIRVDAGLTSELTRFSVYCDDLLAWQMRMSELSAYGCTASTPVLSLTLYGINAVCVAVLTHRFEFRRSLRVTALNVVGGVTVTVWVYPTLMR